MSAKVVLAIVFGLVIISVQLLLPDLVPNYIFDLLSQDNSRFIGLDLALNAALLVYLLGGWGLFFSGTFAMIFSLGNQSE